jgi:hypothetical protein
MRTSSLIAVVALMSLPRGPELGAQSSTVPVGRDSAGASSKISTHKSVALASLLGLAFPGAGHWYAEEDRRALVVAAIYYPTAIYTSQTGNTPARGAIPTILGVAFLGSLAFSWIDGTLAAERHNARLTLTTGPDDARSRYAVRIGLSVSQ